MGRVTRGMRSGAKPSSMRGEMTDEILHWKRAVTDAMIQPHGVGRVAA